MAEYIDRTAATKAICENCMAHSVCDYYKHSNIAVACDDIDRLLSVPAADVAPVVHAHTARDQYGYICSRCKTRFLSAFYNYCFACGARLDEEADE